MSADAQAACFSAIHRVEIFTQAMAAVYPRKSAFVHRLQSEFEPEIGLLVQVAQQVEDIVSDTIGPGRDGNTDDAREVDRLAINFLKFRNRIVRVGVALKISDEIFCFMALCQGGGTLFQLRRDRRARAIDLWRVTRVVAVNAAADGNFAITIGASEILAQTDFVNAAVKSIA